MNTQTYEGIVKVRRNDIDWLRIIAVLLLFPFHTARIFNLGEHFYVKSATLSEPLSYIIAFLGTVAHAVALLPGRRLHVVRPLAPGRRSIRR